jgi:hypothetical protein
VAVWYQDNNLSLNVSKTKELVVDYRKRGPNRLLLTLMGLKWSGSRVKLLGVHITNKLSRSKHTKTVVKRTRQHLFPPQETEKICHGSPDPHHREHSDQLHHCLVWQLLGI